MGVAIAQAQDDLQLCNYIEVNGTARDTIIANRIEITVQLSEEPNKGRTPIAKQQEKFERALTNSGIDIKKQVVMLGQSQRSAKRDDVYQYKNYSVTAYSIEQMNTLFDELNHAKIPGAHVSKYYNDKVEQIRLKLKAKAVLNSKVNAQALVEGLGQSVGKAVRINDYSSSSPVVYERPTMMRSSVANDSMPMKENTSEMENLKLKPIVLSQSVTVRFELL